MQSPRTVKEVQKLVGRIAALNRFISRSSDRGLPFFKVLKKIERFSWTEQCQAAFKDLKKYLASPPLLTQPRLGETLFLYLAISEGAVSAVLVREEDREYQPIYYVSKTLQGPEVRYSKTEKLALALVTTARKLRPYFQSHHVVILKNHPLGKTEIKAQPLADFISEMTGDENSKKNECWKVFVDGSSTSQGGRLALAAGAKRQKTHSDSQLFVNQIRGDYEAEGDRMIKYLANIQTLKIKFDEFIIEQIPRSRNEEVDQLARLASSLTPLKSQCITLLSQGRPEVEAIREEVLTGTISSSWKDELETYLKDGTLLQDPKEARAIRVWANRFTLIGGELYKRGFSQPYLKCINQDKVEYILREIHEGSCGNHSRGRALASKALRQGYFWPTMRKDAMDLVKRCKKYQEHANVTHPCRTNAIHTKSLSFQSMGNRHSRKTSSSPRPMRIFDHCSGLLLKMGRGKGVKQNF
ncbi:hypothetical protein Sango_2082400 [Sesamum angolense]|uniref:Reverse transcriptase/retrotransposon-derived protein RNase H-like domain-containing protein n=1 Tax=Sesamum angolense TaxID=2727404 RepID=A0AAE1WBC7_9LAMI|nr:hypothetical protein Sango_2082400 [Sesamum angolense]